MTRHHATYLQSFISCLYVISPESTLACVFDMQQISPPPSWRSSFTTTMLEQCDDACLPISFPRDFARFRAIPEPDEAEDANIEDIKKMPQVVLAPPPGESGNGCRNSVCKVWRKE